MVCCPELGSLEVDPEMAILMDGVLQEKTYSIAEKAGQEMGEELSKDVASGDSSLTLIWVGGVRLWSVKCSLRSACLEASRLGLCTPAPGSEPPQGGGGLSPAPLSEAAAVTEGQASREGLTAAPTAERVIGNVRRMLRHTRVRESCAQWPPMLSPCPQSRGMGTPRS